MPVITRPPKDVDAEHPGRIHFYSSNAAALLQLEPDLASVADPARQMHSHTANYLQALHDRQPDYFTCYYARTDDTGLCLEAGAITPNPDRLYMEQLAKIESRLKGQRITSAAQSRAERNWRPDPNGRSHFGGRPPDGFSFPDRAHPLAFQYLGYLANEHLPHPVDGDGLHLIFPLLHYDAPIQFFDISTPLAPRPLKDTKCAVLGWDGLKPHHSSGNYPEETDIDHALYEGYTAFQPGDELFYQKEHVAPFALTSQDMQSGESAAASHPSWVHSPEVPLCPVTGEVMLFLGQFGNEAPAIETDFVRRSRAVESSGMAPVFSFSTYDSTNGLFGFYHPVGKTLCFVMQI